MSTGSKSEPSKRPAEAVGKSLPTTADVSCSYSIFSGTSSSSGCVVSDLTCMSGREELVFWLVFERGMSAHSTTAFDVTCYVTAVGTWSKERPFLMECELEVRSEVDSVECLITFSWIEAAQCAATCCSSSSQGSG